jgi:hypothetical protein
LLFYNYFYVHMIWISTKPCMTPAEGMNAYINIYAYKYTYICICDSLIIGHQDQGQVILLSTASRPVHLGVGLPLEQMTRFYISLSDDYFLSSSCRFKFKFKLNYDRQSVGQSVLVLGSHDQIFAFCLTIVDGRLTPWWTGRLIVSHNVTLTSWTDPCGGGLEYLHHSPASHTKWQKRNPVPGGITGIHCSWGI